MKETKKLLEKLKINIEELEILKNEILNKNKFEETELKLLINKTLSIYECLILLKAAIGTELNNYEEQIENKSETCETKNEIILEIQENTFEQKISESSENLENIKQTKKEIQKTLSDKFKTDKEYLYEKLFANKNDSTKLLFSKPVNDLNKVIGLNEKYAIIKELLKGDSNKYNEIIDILNNQKNFNDAYNFIVKDLKWDTNQHIVKYLLDLLRRKFIIKDE